jgi:CBS domain containing-hemolysin-like protein
MDEVKVKDLMVPLAEYAMVSQEATLHEAVLALKEAQERFDQKAYRHRAVLVYDGNKKIVGKLSQNDVLRALEPGYKEIGNLDQVSHWGLSKDFIRSLMKTHGLLQRPLDDICHVAAVMKVRDVMYTPAEGEFVQEASSLNEAIHQLVIGKHQSLLVTGRGQVVVGVLRLTDVFAKVSSIMESCEI